MSLWLSTLFTILNDKSNAVRIRPRVQLRTTARRTLRDLLPRPTTHTERRDGQ